MFVVSWESERDQNISLLDTVKRCHNDIITGDSIVFTVKNTVTGESFEVDLSKKGGYEIEEIDNPSLY